MPWYQPVASPRSLDRFLACSWTATPTGRHRLVPDACVELLWISNGDIWVCGPELAAWDFELPAGVTSTGVRFLPGVAPALFGASAADIADRRLPLRELIGAVVEDDLRRELGNVATLEERRVVMEQFVERLVDRRGNDSDDALDFAERVLNVLASSPRANAALLAAQLGVTVRQLHRKCQHSFGYGPSTLARLLRFQRFVALAELGGERDQRLARLAIDAGYSDQAHLARDCRAITGQTPRAFLDRYFPTFPDMSDPYKTAGSFAVTMSA